MEVSADQVSLLTDVAEPADGIDIERATEARRLAKEALQQHPDDSEAVASLRRAELRLEIAGVVPA